MTGAGDGTADRPGMIDWPAAGTLLAALQDRPGPLRPLLDEVVGAAPPFRNTDYPLSPLPLVVRQRTVTATVPAVERYVALLGRITTLYREVPALRRWYALGPAAEALIDADRQAPDEVTVCRLDGYLEQGTERLRLLENNADAPAGTLFSARINRLVSTVLDRAGAAATVDGTYTLSSEHALLDVLVDALRRRGLDTGAPRVAVLQPAGRSNLESVEMVAAFRRCGVAAVLADPRELRQAGRVVWFGPHPVDVCWNKVNTVAWRTLVEADADLVGRWTRALATADFVHVNPFGARYVAESKFTLALPWDLRFADLFTAAERALVAELLPWARRLGPGATAPDGVTPLDADLVEHPNRYVLKEPYDIRGDGVTVGRATGRTAWREAVDRAMVHGLVAQRYVAPTGYPVLRPDREPPVVTMPVSFDSFVLGGRVHGFGSKASLNPRLNVFQGGQKLAVHVTDRATGAGPAKDRRAPATAAPDGVASFRE
ncbi:hypothetical protein [Micromonospora sagamiensis]|uniref:Circularly permuted ATP-grasp superfamily protein n=1 Tax=Micromonospora sagamiensis TaxID=47875 RepID=A0A562WHF3_9ACTN|nr:hypothetical protein [Micromonospora sagamiensis]TWJ29441.1 hypothetical protein JD81_02951 [Micromonospora sagamiensis]BCL17530.1 hypothetical protein GCM10017556_52690 [Micromonospora sagamiensis]